MFTSSLSLSQQNREWQAAYELNNGMLVKRYVDRIEIYPIIEMDDATREQWTRFNIPIPKLPLIVATTYSQHITGNPPEKDVLLTSAQTQAEFEREVAKISPIQRKIFPL